MKPVTFLLPALSSAAATGQLHHDSLQQPIHLKDDIPISPFPRDLQSRAAFDASTNCLNFCASNIGSMTFSNPKDTATAIDACSNTCETIITAASQHNASQWLNNVRPERSEDDDSALSTMFTCLADCSNGEEECYFDCFTSALSITATQPTNEHTHAYPSSPSPQSDTLRHHNQSELIARAPNFKSTPGKPPHCLESCGHSGLKKSHKDAVKCVGQCLEIYRVEDPYTEIQVRTCCQQIASKYNQELPEFKSELQYCESMMGPPPGAQLVMPPAFTPVVVGPAATATVWELPEPVVTRPIYVSPSPRAPAQTTSTATWDLSTGIEMSSFTVVYATRTQTATVISTTTVIADVPVATQVTVPAMTQIRTCGLDMPTPVVVQPKPVQYQPVQYQPVQYQPVGAEPIAIVTVTAAPEPLKTKAWQAVETSTRFKEVDVTVEPSTAAQLSMGGALYIGAKPHGNAAAERPQMLVGRSALGLVALIVAAFCL